MKVSVFVPHFRETEEPLTFQEVSEEDFTTLWFWSSVKTERIVLKCRKTKGLRTGIAGKATGVSYVLSLKSQLRITTSVERLFNTFFYNDREN